MHNLEHRGDIETIEASSTTTVEYCGNFIDVQNILYDRLWSYLRIKII